MSMRTLLILATAVLLAAAAAAAVIFATGEDGSQPTVADHSGMVEGTVWVANEDGASLTAIDASRNEVAVTLTGIEGPHNLQVSPDGKSVWAVSGHDAMAVMLDATGFEVHGTTRTGGDPAHLIDVATMKPLATIPVGAYPHGMRPSPSGTSLYVANAKGTTLSVIDTRTNVKVADVEVGQSPVQVAFSPNGRFVYASLNAENAVAKVDVATRELVGKVAVGVGPIQVFVSPDGRYLLVANQGTEESPSTTVSIVDTATFEVVETVETGRGAHGVVIDPSSRHAYVTNIYGDDVAVLDLAELQVVARIAVGSKPNGISFSPFGVGLRAQKTVDLGLGDEDDDMDGMGHG